MVCNGSWFVPKHKTQAMNHHEHLEKQTGSQFVVLVHAGEGVNYLFLPYYASSATHPSLSTAHAATTVTTFTVLHQHHLLFPEAADLPTH